MNQFVLLHIRASDFGNISLGHRLRTALVLDLAPELRYSPWLIVEAHRNSHKDHLGYLV